MLKRKIEQQLADWKRDASRKPLVIRGCRQCGKTYSVLAFARTNYNHVIYLDFFEQPQLKNVFADALDVDTITMLLTAYFGPGTTFVPGETVIILDEIQECPDARTALKFFHKDGRYDVIATGSLLGMHGYGQAPRSVPVGSETMLTMYPLDFEEFCWAHGVGDDIKQTLRSHLTNITPVPKALHIRMRELIQQYVVVGGMPEAVQTFVDSKQISQVQTVQHDILSSYQDDMIKYAPPADKSHIKECFQSIPRQLAKENKKFQYSIVRKGSKASTYAGSLQWIEDAGIIRRCYNMTTTGLPLDGYADTSTFKVYMSDIGLLVAMLEEGTAFDVLQGNMGAYKGAIYENLAADIFTKMGRDLYYLHKESGLEIDFVIRYESQCTIVEVKATTGNAKSAKTVLRNPDKYHVYEAIKLGDYNVGLTEIEQASKTHSGNEDAAKDGRSAGARILTLPLYMMYLLDAR